MAVEYLQQLYQRQGRLSFAVLIARECIHPAAENLSGFALVKVELFPHARDEIRDQR